MPTLKVTTRWVGWPGEDVATGAEQADVAALLAAHACVPVWMSKELLDLYYNGFCNGVLWQLFHYVPVQARACTAPRGSFSTACLRYALLVAATRGLRNVCRTVLRSCVPEGRGAACALGSWTVRLHEGSFEGNIP